MKKEKIADLVNTRIDELNSALESGHSVHMAEVQKLMARFHKYSFKNCVLIAEQFPDATKVMGFHGWKAVGRSVKKGEKGIGIAAPLAVRKKDAIADEKEVRGFRVVHVFDISQTEGDALPELSDPKGDVADWIAPVEQLIKSKGIRLEYGLLGDGVYASSSLKMITVLSGLRPPLRLDALVHELAHELMHPDLETRMRLTHAVKETEAQAVAQIVCQALGLEGNEHTVDYIHLHDGDSDVFAKSMQRIQKCSSGILAELLCNDDNTVRRKGIDEEPHSELQTNLAA